VVEPGLLVVEVDDGGDALDRDVEVGRARRRPPWWLAVAVAAALVVAAALTRQHPDTAAPSSDPTTVVATSSPRTPPPSGGKPVVPAGLVAFVASTLPDRPGLWSVELDTGLVRPLVAGAVAFPSFGAVATMGDAAVVLTDDGSSPPSGGWHQTSAPRTLDRGGRAAHDAGRVGVWRVSSDAGRCAELLTETEHGCPAWRCRRERGLGLATASAGCSW
jgi:hypothetical protein